MAMASATTMTTSLRSFSASTASSSGSQLASVAAAAAHRPAAAAGSLVSRFYGVRLAARCKVGAGVSKKVKFSAGNVFATATADTSVKPYTLPTWANFEMGYYPVYWETATGRPPTSGQLLTIFFNAASSKLKPNVDFGIAFNGGFNQPIMCGGEPRVMSKKKRGSLCEPFYSIKINVPLHATSLEFSFTDGVNWDGPYKLIMELPDKLKGLPQSYFNERLGKDLAEDGACESAIYPEAVFIQDRCTFPAGMIQQGVQFLDRHHLLIKFGSVDEVLRNSEASHQTAFLAVHNVETTEILAFCQNSSEELLQLVERYWDHFRVVPQNPLYMSFISSCANNSFARAREQVLKERDACLSGKAGSYTQVIKRTLAFLPHNSQSQSLSAYCDQYLFNYVEKLISSTDRHKPCAEHSIKSISRRRPNTLKFKINAGVSNTISLVRFCEISVAV